MTSPADDSFFYFQRPILPLIISQLSRHESAVPHLHVVQLSNDTLPDMTFLASSVYMVRALYVISSLIHLAPTDFALSGVISSDCWYKALADV